MNRSFVIKGNLADAWQNKIYTAEITVENGFIKSIRKTGDNISTCMPYIMPGFIDSHVHIESSMLIPSEFAKIAVVHGTVATVSDPHEIANVCGLEGVRYMIENGKKTPFKFYFGAPSCVPATTFETAGAAVNSDDVKALLAMDEIKYLSEMMNFPGVLYKDEEVWKKIEAAKAVNKPIDGHAPGLRGEEARKYIEAGISTDHECFTREEAMDKLQYGMKILIREGSAAKNFEALIDLLKDHPDEIMFCSDDKHPDSLADGHINLLCKRAVDKGIDVFNIIKAACINPVLHYKLDVGLLRENDPADFILVKDLVEFEPMATYINGECVSENGQSNIKSVPATVVNKFDCSFISEDQLSVPYCNEEKIPVIEAIDGQLITNKLAFPPLVIDGRIVSDPARDILKIVVVNRYQAKPVSTAWIKNFGLREGAIASSVAHDSHNIIAVGVDDNSLQKAINLIIKEKGGVSCVSQTGEMVLPLPVAGLMSAEDGRLVAQQYTAIDQMAKRLGSTLQAPYMTLSFMALLVIPHLKLSDKGLFDGDDFKLIN